MSDTGRTLRRPHADTPAAASTGPILPGAVLGVLGGGQLGRMFALAARRLGYRVHVLTDVPDSPAGQVADREVAADLHDAEAVSSFARDVAVVTFEWENVPAEAAEVASDNALVRPGPQALRVSQNRVREKSFLRDAGVPVTPFTAVRSAADLEAAHTIGFPAVLKTAEWGYDGKGQALVREPAELVTAWEAIGRREAILERFVDFDRELSVVAVRGADGAFAAYAPFENTHRDHILDVTVSPADVPPAVGAQAVEIALTVMERLDFIGVVCIELFWTRQGELLANEIAPRPHNSGHLTIDAHLTSQFEQQVRAVCGLPLGSTHQRTPAAMANLLGDLWDRGTPDWTRVLAQPEIALHLYGKTEARPGRKMGHLTALASSPDVARDRVLAARRLLADL
jgi:5-(carboxyamino)imidazole ribonucleotide synthase